jgi:hypothetical protein
MSAVMINDNFLRLLVWCIYRGEIDYPKVGINPSMIFKLTKVTRIERLTEILNNLNMPYSHTKETKSRAKKALQDIIYISAIDTGDICSYLNYKQEYPEWFLNLSKEQAKVVFNEIPIAGGHWLRAKTLQTYLKINRDAEILKKLNEKHFKCKFWQGTHYTGSHILKIHQLKQEIN